MRRTRTDIGDGVGLFWPKSGSKGWLLKYIATCRFYCSWIPHVYSATRFNSRIVDLNEGLIDRSAVSACILNYRN